jgi:GrpB-like predicted nucleotidyltransferase (UPF0157 family)
MTEDRMPRRTDAVDVELVGGTEKRHLEVVGYDDRWPTVYAWHRDRVDEALRAVDVDIEHIGSTSVPGLAAKPIIDILVAVDDITAEEDYLDALLAAGYVLRVREPGHRLVRTPHLRQGRSGGRPVPRLPRSSPLGSRRQGVVRERQARPHQQGLR